MKRGLYLFIPVMVVWAAFAQDTSDLPPEIRAIKERGYIIVSMYYKDVKPFMFHDDEGNFTGHEVELAKDIAEAMGVGVRFDRSPQTFNQIVKLVADGEADMAISLLSRTLSRAQIVRFTRPYIVLRPTLLISRLAASRYDIDLIDPIGSLADRNLRIAEKQGTSYVGKAATLFPNARVDEYGEWEESIDAVLDPSNPAEVVLRDEIGINNYIAEFPDESINLQIIPLEEERYKDPLAIAVNRNAVHLQQWLNLYFEQNGVTGTAEALLKPYEAYYE